MSRNKRKARKRTDFIDGLPCKSSNSFNSRSIERKFPESLNWFMCPRLKTLGKGDNGQPVLLSRRVGPWASCCAYRSCIELSLLVALYELHRVIHSRAVGFSPMPEREHLLGRLRFGVFEVDLRAGELRKHGLQVRLQKQPFQVLVMLLGHPGEVVTREELQKKLWPADTFVDFDHGLNKAINKIREALGDSAGSPRFVETVARRGYRFLAEVKVADAIVAHDAGSLSQILPMATVPSLPDPAVKRATPNHYLPSLGMKISILVAVALMAVPAAWMLRFRNRPPPAIRSLAV